MTKIQNSSITSSQVPVLFAVNPDPSSPTPDLLSVLMVPPPPESLYMESYSLPTLASFSTPSFNIQSDLSKI